MTEHPFRCSSRALDALPASGKVLVLAGVALIPLYLQAGPAWFVAAATVAGLLGAVTLGLRTALSRPGAHDRHDANLIVTRAERPSRWLVAHLDTKAQAQSMAGRLVAIWVTVAACLAALASAALHLQEPISPTAGLLVGLLLILAGWLLSRGRLEGRSAGACDNGSGVLALLVAAEASRDPALGFIITGAEEFGMLGAVALARERAELLAGTDVINLDTLDDRGTLFVVHHDQRGQALADQLCDLVRDQAPRVRRRRLPLGILADSVPLSRVAGRVVTIGRLDWGTLRRIHTPADAPGSLSYDTARAIGRLLASRFDRLQPGE